MRSRVKRMGIRRRTGAIQKLLVLLLAMVVVASCGQSSSIDQQPHKSQLRSMPTSTPRTVPVPETLVATARGHITELAAFERPEGPAIELPFNVPNPHQFGNPMTLMVTEGDSNDDWIEVQLPIKPNGQRGWVESSDFRLSSTTIRAEVDLSETSVVVYEGRKVVARTDAVVGSSSTPTPIGTFYVTAKKENVEDYLGPWALALSSFSEVYTTFAGGLPVVAIHGTNRPEQMGEARSNGCIRVPNEVVTFLAETVPLGAPVKISA